MYTYNSNLGLSKSPGDLTLSLSEREEPFSRIFHSNPDAMFIIGAADGRFFDANGSFLRIFGYQKEEVIGRTPAELNMMVESEKSAQTIQSPHKPTSLYHIEGVYRTKTGKLINVLCLLEIISINGQNHYLCTLIDVTERRRAEDALKRSEARFRSLFEKSYDAQLLTVPGGNILSANPAACEMFGMTEDELKISRRTELIMADERYKRAIEEREKTGKVKALLTFKRKDGSTFEGEVTSTLFTDTDGIPKTSMIIRDITERSNVERKLAENEERLRIVVEASKVMVYETDVKSGKVTIYSGSEGLVGFNPEEVDFTVDWVSSRIHPDDLASVLERLEAINYKSCEGYAVKYRFLHKSGKYVTVQDTAKVIRDSSGKVIRIIGGAYDISEREQDKEKIEQYSKCLEQLVEERTKQLRNSERMAAIGATAGMVGHDLRNPLQTITNEVYLANNELERLPDGEQKSNLQESIETIAEQIGYMDKIVSDLQTFVKPVEARKTTVNLKTLIVHLMGQLSIPENIQASTRVEDALTVNADSQLLRRVLINLITNAVQAMPGGGKLAVEAQADRSGRVQIAVKDTGTGIPEEIKPKIFTPLFTTKSKGQGFGLAVCKRVLEAQGGTISFQSQVGKGTTFTVEFPAR